MSRHADVVVPIYAGVEQTVRCVESVLRHSGPALRRLLLIDDASPDPEMPAALEALRQRAPEVVRVLRNERNLGFVGTANRGLALRGGDVVLLNSDTEVTAGWLAELLEVASSSPFVGAVVPLSNNATLCSIPAFCEAEDAAALRSEPLELATFPLRTTEMPTGVGFCMVLRHAALQAVGLFDPAFGRGYNEENDWCVRARRAGFTILRANRALVFHEGGTSFQDEKRLLDLHNARLLSQRHPDYLEDNRRFAQAPEAHVAAAHAAHRLGRARVAVEGDATPQLVEALGPLIAEAGRRPEVVHRRGQRLQLEDVTRLLALSSALVVDGPEPHLLGEPSDDQTDLWQLLLPVADVVTAPTRVAGELLVERFHLDPDRVRVVPPIPLAQTAARRVTAPERRWVVLGDARGMLDGVLTAQLLLEARMGEDAPRLMAPWPATWGAPPVRVDPLPSSSATPEQLLERLRGAFAAVIPGIRGCSASDALLAVHGGVTVVTLETWGARELLGDAAVYLATPEAEELAAALERLLRHPPTPPRSAPIALAPVVSALEELYGWALEHPDAGLLARRGALARVLSSGGRRANVAL